MKRVTRIFLPMFALALGFMVSVPTYAQERINIGGVRQEMRVVESYEPQTLMAKDDLTFKRTLGMTDRQVLRIYEEYLGTNISAMSADDFTLKKLEGFTNYAVEAGIINDTLAQKAVLTKAVVRAEFKLVVAGGELCKFTTASTFLNHSLQDSPSDLSYGSSSSIAKQLTDSSEYTTILNEFKRSVTGKNVTSKSYTGSTTLNSSKDLHLAYNKVSYSVEGKKKNNKWTVKITFTDTYDFESQAWKNAMTDSKIVTILNNYAAYAQKIGAIVPFNITVTTETTY
ncbi:MAG: hypothetical protein MJ123_11770 [Lachnospiraceae bacterium]|nr:hypothetical protein [Lachnospiraceae bacterium]